MLINSKSVQNTPQEINYLNPDVPPQLPWVDVPLVKATPESLQNYGVLVEDYHDFPIEIVTWPAPGWRPVDPGTGNQGGTTSGNFDFWWSGDILYGQNQGVNDQYLLGWSTNPGQAAPALSLTSRDFKAENGWKPNRVLLWHANYHPDSGQLFFPLNKTPFIAPLALPGDDIKPEDFVAFYVEGVLGLYIHPHVWHEAVFPLGEKASFYSEQGKVHARVSCNIAQEFGVFLNVPLIRP